MMKHEEKSASSNYIYDNKNCYVCDPIDDNENFCIKEDGKDKFIPGDSYITFYTFNN